MMPSIFGLGKFLLVLWFNGVLIFWQMTKKNKQVKKINLPNSDEWPSS